MKKILFVGVVFHVITSPDALKMSSTETEGPPAVWSPSSCLELTTPGLKLNYPTDAEDHFHEIHETLRNFSSKARPACPLGFCGPWIEDDWIDTFGGLWNEEKQQKGKGARLAHIFGPFIPILYPFFNTEEAMSDRPAFEATINGVLRPDVPYIIVTQDMVGSEMLHIESFPNLLVISAGGFGHVPVPLYKQQEALSNVIPMKDRKYLTSYVGSNGHGPKRIRERMIDALDGDRSKFYHGKIGTWRDVMINSKTQLVPRGFGRTAYHYVEAVQLGLIPIHIYTDVPWIPYRHKLQNLTFATHIDEFPRFLQQLQQMSDYQLEEMEKGLNQIRESHFSRKGIMTQIARFMQEGKGDLECVHLPPSRTDM